MEHLEVSGAVRHIYIYIIRRLKVKLYFTDTSVTKVEFYLVQSKPVSQLETFPFEVNRK